MKWDIWTVNESLRRTIFLLEIIHQLLGATKILEPAYFEPLFPQEVFEHIRLPSNDELWTAGNEEEWLEARQRGEDQEGTKLGEAIRRINDLSSRENRAGEPAMSGGDMENDTGIRHERGSMEHLPELTKLIVSVSSINVKEL
jgi:hypothetical protein